MRIKLQSLFLVSACILANLFLFSSAFADSIHWHSYNGAFAKAKAEHKLVLIYGKSDSCHWCNRVQSESFSDNQIVNLINKKYVPVSVDVVNNASVADSYGINGTPTFIVLNASQQELSRIPGYASPSKLYFMLEEYSGK